MRTIGLVVLSLVAGVSIQGMDLPDPELCRQALEASGAPSTEQIRDLRELLIAELNALQVGPLTTLTMEAPPRRFDLPMVDPQHPFSASIAASMQAITPLDPLRDIAFTVRLGAKVAGRGVIRFVPPAINVSSEPFSVPNPYVRIHVLELALDEVARSHQYGRVFLRILRNSMPLGSKLSFWVQHEASEMALDKIVARFDSPPWPLMAMPDSAELSLLEETVSTGYHSHPTLSRNLNTVLADPAEAAKVPMINVLRRLGFEDPFAKVFEHSETRVTRFYLEMTRSH